ncbi:MAG: PQQ-like beta-propeller repeat protein [Pirellulales bacterium]|nr:PQQ-like beta-propeller repeat protein [Pirellulales bacterium]
MIRLSHGFRLIASSAAIGGLLCAWTFASAQVPSLAAGNRFELAETIQLDRADNTVQTYLDRVRTHLTDRQWNEAVDTLLQVMENSGGKLLPVTEHRYVSVRDYCQLQLVSLPPEALAVYRSRVDSAARAWYEQGVAQRDCRRLLDVTDQMLASSWGDNALFALGEIALEQGDCAAARAYWEKAVPLEHPGDGPRTWLCVPDTDLDLAAVRARLVLASILEGSTRRAKEELDRFRQLHPDARGPFGGQEIKYADALGTMLAESTNWPTVQTGGDWPTFAGSPFRNRIAPRSTDPASVLWRLPLRESLPANRSLWGTVVPKRRVAEDDQAPLSYHPVIVGDLVLVNDQIEILAVDLKTGQPAWAHGSAAVYQDQFDEAVHALYHPSDTLGVPRFTMTAHGGKLFARMGSAVTSRPREQSIAGGRGYLVCLDLESEGRLLWKMAPDEEGLAFEGSPVADDNHIYVAMRRSDIQPQAIVACYAADTGELVWRQFVCAAETPARGMLHETTHNLLTLDGDTVYFNTNLGAVAALSARDGRLKWVSLYPRVRQGDLFKPPPYWSRDLNPCVFDRGKLYVAPADSRRIFALDAATGQIVWQTGTEVEAAVHLLGVAGDKLIACGEKLYWIGTDAEEQGQVKHVWPDGNEKLGHGRGLLAANLVYWPTREQIYVFDQTTAQLKKQIPLIPRGVTGGNLFIAGDCLVIATANQLIALTESPAPPTEANPVTAKRNSFHSGNLSSFPGSLIRLSCPLL